MFTVPFVVVVSVEIGANAGAAGIVHTRLSPESADETANETVGSAETNNGL